MALNFPDSPANGDTTTLNGVSYTYDSTKTVWVSTTGPITTVAVSDTAPTTPTDGDMWFNSSDLKLYIRYNDGATSQWIIAAPAGPAGADSTVAGPAGPSGGDGRAGVYADMAALIAKTGMVAGDTALVTALNKVFMYTGSAWFLIATMTNASPSAITGVGAAYDLATDGTATTITAVSTDPEGFALTWSYAVTTGSLGSTATVSQADNVFTVTPSTTEADAGSFSITFSVTDGATGAVNAVSAFSLSFIVTNSRYTALSVKATNTGSNQTFNDASTLNHTVTANGDTTASTFSPYRHGGYSIENVEPGYIPIGQLIDGYGPSTSTTDTFTIETWVYQRNRAPSSTDPANPRASGLYVKGYTYMVWGIANTGKLYLHHLTLDPSGNMAWYNNVSANIVPLKTWTHIAIVVSGGVIKFFIDGNLETVTELRYGGGDASFNGQWRGLWNNGAGSLENILGGNVSGTDPYRFDGYVHNYRISDIARYSTNFTPAESFTSDSNTQLLIGRLPYLKDLSPNNSTLIPVGGSRPYPFNVTDNSPYSEADHGASVHFGEANGNAIIIPTTAATTTGDYTIEFWIRYNTNKSGQQTLSAVDGDHRIVYNGGRFIDWRSGGTQTYWQNADGTLYQSERPGIWTHFAQTRTSGVVKAWINGVGSANTVTDTTSWATSRFGSEHNSSSENFEGDMADIRITHSAIYSSDFTPPTAPLTAITNTKFLLNPETSISDLSQSSAITCVGNAATSTTQVKFAGTKSIAFDGTGDYLSTSSSNLLAMGTGNFTIECWVWKTDINRRGIWQIGSNASGIGTGPELGFGWHIGVWQTYMAGLGPVTTPSFALSLDTWYHTALVRNNGTTKLYINGTEELSVSDTHNYTGTYMAIGGYYNTDFLHNGYIQDLRVTKGLARYTANFTPPTAEFQG